MNNRVLFEKPNIKKLKEFGYNPFDLHYHTKYSDGHNGIKISTKKAKRLGFGFAVTDHNEIKGSVEAFRRKECPIIPAIEVTSREFYDILLYFYDINDLIDFYVKNVKGKKWDNRGINWNRLRTSFIRLLDASEEYNCLVAPAHPFAYKPKTSFEIFEEEPDLIKRFDAIEVINGTMTQKQNLRCFNWAQKLEKPMIGGSDSHDVANLGRIITALKEDSVEGVLNSLKQRKHLLIGKGFNMIAWYYHGLAVLRRNIKII